jgi:two-component system, OmpR family, KDP operon response regulator KdpE
MWFKQREEDANRVKSRRVLIIEDDEYAREGLEYFLTAEGFQTQAVAEGKAGYRAARRTLPDVILLDLGLPDMDGKHLIERMRSHRQLRTTPILVVSGSATEIVEELKALGANAVLTKPVLFDQLKDILQNL